MTKLNFFRKAISLLCAAVAFSMIVPPTVVFAQLTSQQKIDLRAALIAEAKRYDERLAVVETYYRKEELRLVAARRAARNQELEGVTDRAQGKAIRHKCAVDENEIEKQVNRRRLDDRAAEKEVNKFNVAAIRASFGLK